MREFFSQNEATGVSVVDVYEGAGNGAGKKSLAIAVTLQPAEKTLTDAEIDAKPFHRSHRRLRRAALRRADG